MPRGTTAPTIVMTPGLSATRAATAPATPHTSLPSTTPQPASLIAAAERGDVTEIQRLIRAGIGLEGRDTAGRTALLAATHADKVEVARLLIEAGADVNAKDNIQDSAFLYSAAEGRLEILRLTLAHGADLSATNRFGGTALIPASHHGHVAVVRELLKTKIDLDHVNRLGWTALLEAVILGDGGPVYTEIIGLLLDAGARPEIADTGGVTALAHARARGYAEMAAVLERVLQTGETAGDLEASLRRTAQAGDTAGVVALLRRGVEVDARGGDGSTALVLAARGLHLDVVKLLIAAGASVNIKDNRQESAYLIATSEVGDSAAALELLLLTLANGADIRSLDSYNGTGLIRAADRGYVEIVRALLGTGIAIDHVNRLGWTALLESIILGKGDARHTEVVRLLAGAGANVNLADAGGVTPLQHATRNGYSEMEDILRAAGGR